MKKMTMLAAVAAGTIMAVPATAQSWSDEQTAVWQAVSASWERNVDNGQWHTDMTANAYGWNDNTMTPNSRDDIRRASGVFGAEGEVLYYRLTPLAISVHGDTALVHYFADVVETDHKGERDGSTERCSDTMVMDEGRWKFLGWGCAEMGGDDD